LEYKYHRQINKLHVKIKRTQISVTSSQIVLSSYLKRNHVIPSAGSDMGKST